MLAYAVCEMELLRSCDGLYYYVHHLYMTIINLVQSMPGEDHLKTHNLLNFIVLVNYVYQP